MIRALSTVSQSNDQALGRPPGALSRGLCGAAVKATGPVSQPWALQPSIPLHSLPHLPQRSLDQKRRALLSKASRILAVWNHHQHGPFAIFFSNKLLDLNEKKIFLSQQLSNHCLWLLFICLPHRVGLSLGCHNDGAALQVCLWGHPATRMLMSRGPPLKRHNSCPAGTHSASCEGSSVYRRRVRRVWGTGLGWQVWVALHLHLGLSHSMLSAFYSVLSLLLSGCVKWQGRKLLSLFSFLACRVKKLWHLGLLVSFLGKKKKTLIRAMLMSN